MRKKIQKNIMNNFILIYLDYYIYIYQIHKPQRGIKLKAKVQLEILLLAISIKKKSL